MHLVKDTLDMHPHVEHWSVDIDDDDKILRIVSRKLDHRKIIELVGLCGYTCEELRD